MKYDCSKATKICLWFQSDYGNNIKAWRLTFLKPSWWCCVIPVSKILVDGDEVVINKTCRIDINRRVIIDGDVFRLLVYGKGNPDIAVTITRI